MILEAEKHGIPLTGPLSGQKQQKCEQVVENSV